MPGDEDAGGQRDQRGDENLSERTRQHASDDACVEHKHRARDGGEADRHRHEEFGARQLFQIRPDEERRLHHADKGVCRRGETDGAADAQALLQEIAETARDPAEHPPVPQKRRERRHDEDERQGLEGEDETVLRGGRFKGRSAATVLDPLSRTPAPPDRKGPPVLAQAPGKGDDEGEPEGALERGQGH